MTREIKFRYWSGKEMRPLKLGESWYDMPEDLPIMQYTSLKDKNGKEIYEGDIMRGFNPNDPTFEIKTKVVKWDSKGLWMGIGWNDEIIGSIYENPELLDKDQSK